MKNKEPQQTQLSTQELQLIERLRERPELMERFGTILAIATGEEGPIKSADEVEGLLIEELRRLGNETMGSFATGAERRLAEQLRQGDPRASVRKKNAEVVVCIWRGERGRTDLADPPKELRAFVACGDWRASTRAFPAIGTGIDGFWV